MLVLLKLVLFQSQCYFKQLELLFIDSIKNHFGAQYRKHYSEQVIQWEMVTPSRAELSKCFWKKKRSKIYFFADSSKNVLGFFNTLITRRQQIVFSCQQYIVTDSIMYNEILHQLIKKIKNKNKKNIETFLYFCLCSLQVRIAIAITSWAPVNALIGLLKISHSYFKFFKKSCSKPAKI